MMTRWLACSIGRLIRLRREIWIFFVRRIVFHLQLQSAIVHVQFSLGLLVHLNRNTSFRCAEGHCNSPFDKLRITLMLGMTTSVVWVNGDQADDVRVRSIQQACPLTDGASTLRSYGPIMRVHGTLKPSINMELISRLCYEWNSISEQWLHIRILMYTHIKL